MTDQEPILHRVESETYSAFRVTQITRGTAVGTILDDEPHLTIGDAFQDNYYGATITFYVILTAPSTDVVTVVASRPLTKDEVWQPVPRGGFLILRDGTVIER